MQKQDSPLLCQLVSFIVMYDIVMYDSMMYDRAF